MDAGAEKKLQEGEAAKGETNVADAGAEKKLQEGTEPAAAATESQYPVPPPTPNVLTPTPMDFPSILHKDCFLLFRSLCKLSMKGLPGDPAHQIDTVAVQSKILSLELILSILENSGASFRTGDKFIYLIRTYLCQSLLKNCISNITQVVDMSLRIFHVLFLHFKVK